MVTSHRLPKSVSKQQLDKRVTEVLNMWEVSMGGMDGIVERSTRRYLVTGVTADSLKMVIRPKHVAVTK
jgi:hypothetical protein